jgi:hypothetical protein
MNIVGTEIFPVLRESAFLRGRFRSLGFQITGPRRRMGRPYTSRLAIPLGLQLS